MKPLKNAINVWWQLFTLWLKMRKRAIRIWYFRDVLFPILIRYHAARLWLAGQLARLSFHLRDTSSTWMWTNTAVYPPFLDRYGDEQEEILEERY